MTAPDLLAPYDLTGRIALVTGGTGGIGRACVERLTAYGATVVATCVEGVDDPATELATFNGLKGVTVQPLDLSQPASIHRCIDAAVSSHGRIDILVNNAAVGSATVAKWASDAETQDSRMLEINADGTLKISQKFLALPDAPDKKLINISSVGGGIATFPGFRLSDGMSKSAVAFLTRQLAAEAVHLNVDIFAICPGRPTRPCFKPAPCQK